MSIGTRLRGLLEAQGIPQTALARKLGISPSTLNGYVTDYREPDAQMLSQLARELHTTTDYLITGHTQPAPAEGYQARVSAIAHNEGVTLTHEQEEAVTRYMKFLLAEDDTRGGKR